MTLLVLTNLFGYIGLVFAIITDDIMYWVLSHLAQSERTEASCTTAFVFLPPALKSSINVSVLVPPANHTHSVTEAPPYLTDEVLLWVMSCSFFLTLSSFCHLDRGLKFWFNPQNFVPQLYCFLSGFCYFQHPDLHVTFHSSALHWCFFSFSLSVIHKETWMLTLNIRYRYPIGL